MTLNDNSPPSYLSTLLTLWALFPKKNQRLIFSNFLLLLSLCSPRRPLDGYLRYTNEAISHNYFVITPIHLIHPNFVFSLLTCKRLRTS